MLRLLRVLRREGVGAAWMKLLHELALYRRLRLLDIPHDDDGSAGGEPPVRVALLASAELDRYLAFRPDQDAAEIRRRLEAGHWCFAGWHAGKIVSATWSCTGTARVDYLECRIRLPARVVFSYDVWTHPEFRGRRASMAVFDWRRRWLREQGYARSVTTLWPENLPAARRLASRPHSVFGTLGTLKIGGWKRHVLRTRRDAVEAGAPLVTLDADQR